MLDRQGTPQQRPESPTVTPPGMRVTGRYICKTDFLRFPSVELASENDGGRRGGSEGSDVKVERGLTILRREEEAD